MFVSDPRVWLGKFLRTRTHSALLRSSLPRHGSLGVRDNSYSEHTWGPSRALNPPQRATMLRGGARICTSVLAFPAPNPIVRGRVHTIATQTRAGRAWGARLRSAWAAGAAGVGTLVWVIQNESKRAPCEPLETPHPRGAHERARSSNSSSSSSRSSSRPRGFFGGSGSGLLSRPEAIKEVSVHPPLALHWAQSNLQFLLQLVCRRRSNTL
jgi:hypothetical protein